MRVSQPARGFAGPSLWDDFLATGFQDRNRLVGITRLTSDS
jgi:hypothetical protein